MSISKEFVFRLDSTREWIARHPETGQIVYCPTKIAARSAYYAMEQVYEAGKKSADPLERRLADIERRLNNMEDLV